MAELHPLLRVCIPENHVRSTHYSDVYRAFVNLDGGAQTVDVEHIHFPFSEKRAETLTRQHNLSPAELSAYQSAMARSVKNAILFSNRLRNDPGYQGAHPEDNLNAVAKYLYQDLRKNDDGSVDVFLVTPTMTRYLVYDRYFTRRENDPGRRETHFTNLLNIFHRTLIILRRIHDAGAHIGVLDMDAICEVEAMTESGQPKDYMALTSFVYARYNDETPIPYPAILPFNAHPDLAKSGAVPTAETDLYSWAFLFLTILNGTYGTAFPDASQRPDPCVPQTLVDALYRALEGKSTYGELKKLVINAKKATPENNNNFYVVVNVEQPYFLDEDISDDEEEEEEDDCIEVEEGTLDPASNNPDPDDNSQENELVFLEDEEEPEEDELSFLILDGEDEEDDLLILDFDSDDEPNSEPSETEQEQPDKSPGDQVPDSQTEEEQEEFILDLGEPVESLSRKEKKKAEKARKNAEKAEQKAEKERQKQHTAFVNTLETAQNAFDKNIQKCIECGVSCEELVACIEGHYTKVIDRIRDAYPRENPADSASNPEPAQDDQTAAPAADTDTPVSQEGEVQQADT